MRCRTFLVLVATVGCASATTSGDVDDDIDARVNNPDGSLDPDAALPVDARLIDAPIDAPPVQMATLSQSSSLTITADNSLACTQSTTGFTTENSYYRAFRLSDHGVTSQFTANRVDVAVENAVAGSGTSQTIQVKLYTVAGTFPAGVLTQIAGQVVTVPNTTTGTTIPVTMSPPGIAPAGSTLVAEVFVPDGRTIGNQFFIGSNTATETGPSYIRAPDCSTTNPVTFAATGNPGVHVILTVTGTY